MLRGKKSFSSRISNPLPLFRILNMMHTSVTTIPIFVCWKVPYMRCSAFTEYIFVLGMRLSLQLDLLYMELILFACSMLTIFNFRRQKKDLNATIDKLQRFFFILEECIKLLENILLWKSRW